MKNKRKFLCSVLLFLAMPGLAVGSSPQTDGLFISEDAALTVLFPGRPTLQESNLAGVVIRNAVFQQEDCAFALSYAPLQVEASEFDVNAALIESVVGHARMVGGEVVDVKDVKLDGFFGKESLIKARNLWMVEKKLIDTEGPILYTAQVVSQDRSQTGGQDAKTFFDSLRIKKRLRTWTDSSGEYTREARFVALDGEVVRIVLADGRKIQMPLNRLSEADREYAIRSHGQKLLSRNRVEVVTPSTSSTERLTDSAKQSTALSRLRGILLAMHTYADANNLRFPAPAIQDASGKQLLSWRVVILPYLGEEDLYKKFKLNEPWDSNNNKQLLRDMPSLFRSPNSIGDGLTTFLMPNGPGAVGENKDGLSLREFSDGLSRTVLCVEVNDDQAVPWTKPVDWEYTDANPLAGLGDSHEGGRFGVITADGNARMISKDVDKGKWGAALTYGGGESQRLD